MDIHLCYFAKFHFNAFAVDRKLVAKWCSVERASVSPGGEVVCLSVSGRIASLILTAGIYWSC